MNKSICIYKKRIPATAVLVLDFFSSWEQIDIQCKNLGNSYWFTSLQSSSWVWVQEKTEAEKQTNYKEKPIFSSQVLQRKSQSLLTLAPLFSLCIDLTDLQLEDGESLSLPVNSLHYLRQTTHSWAFGVKLELTTLLKKRGGKKHLITFWLFWGGVRAASSVNCTAAGKKHV